MCKFETNFAEVLVKVIYILSKISRNFRYFFRKQDKGKLDKSSVNFEYLQENFGIKERF